MELVIFSFLADVAVSMLSLLFSFFCYSAEVLK
jgi:hypothetical protein